MDRPPPERIVAAEQRSKAEESLAVATLLTASGGYLDAFTWLAHGHVLANTQSANVVLLGVHAALGDWEQASRHVPPIVAFVLGVCAAIALRSRDGDGKRTSLTLEIVLLGLVLVAHDWLPSFAAILVIAFAAAVQTTRFARVERWPFSSVMTTGNLRQVAEALYAAALGRSDEALARQGRVFGAICLAFCVGATAGAFVTAQVGSGALALPVLLLVAALVLCGIGER